MSKIILAAFAVLLTLTSGCVHHRNHNARVEYQHTETRRTNDGAANGNPEMINGRRSQRSETIETQHESTTTERRRN